MLHSLQPRSERRPAVILVVVLSMLALMAVLGLTFSNYATASKTGSTTFSNAWQKANGGDLNNYAPSVDPEEAFRFAMAQLIYDVPDNEVGVKSAIRGHSLARTLYGYSDSQLNIQPFNGTGRYSHSYASGSPFFGGAGFWNNEFNYINYTKFADLPLRDPEYDITPTALRASPSSPHGSFVGGANPAVTYPDLNNLALSASKSDGTLMLPSLHRPWLFGSLGTANPNWTNKHGKLLTLRPRPADNLVYYNLLNPQDTRVGFPYPRDGGGDVKNKEGAPAGPNGEQYDSIWIDLNFPVQKLPDGRRYKPLFAFLVEDLDNRINLNTAGNLMARSSGNRSHASNQGWGKWEVNPGFVLPYVKPSPPMMPNPPEWHNLLSGGNNLLGRYGTDGLPSNLAGATSGNYMTRFFDQGDWNACDENNGFVLNGGISIPGGGQFFANFPVGYGNGKMAEHQNHAALFDFFRPRGFGAAYDDRSLPISDMRKLLVNTWTGKDTMTGDVVQLTPNNLDPRVALGGAAQANKRRQLITMLSMQMNRLGMAPWLYNRSGNMNQAADNQIPRWDAQNTELLDNSSKPLLRRSNYLTASPTRQSLPVENIFEKVNLDRPLGRYPHLDTATYNATYNTAMPQPIKPNYARFDDPNYSTTTLKKFRIAERDRQNLAGDIFLRLLYITGTPSPSAATLTSPTDGELRPIRWMAQLAVNIVDFIDEDEISTPFNFYRQAFEYYSPGSGKLAAHITELNGNIKTENVPKYWVLGTELPSVVLNEVYTEFDLPTDGAGKVEDGKFDVNVWAELFCPFPATVTGSTQQRDSQGNPLHIPSPGMGAGATSPYRIVLANNPGSTDSLHPAEGNVLGTPQSIRSTADFKTAQVNTVGNGMMMATVDTEVSPQQANGYFLVGPNGTKARGRGKGLMRNQGNTRDNTIKSMRVPANLPWYKTDDMEYEVTYTDANMPKWAPDDSNGKITVLLRRLANPHLPEQSDLSQADPDDPMQLGYYNPYITVDFIEQIPLNDVTDRKMKANESYAYGKKQPYAAYNGNGTKQIEKQVYAADPKEINVHTLGVANDPNTTATWLVHRDRGLASPYELLLVSGCRQHELTQRFFDDNGNGQKHLVPWFDEDITTGQSHRLYRLFGCLTTADRANGISVYGRQPGPININTVFDYEIFEALCDRNNSNNFTHNPPPTMPPAPPAKDDVNTVWQKLLQRRHANPSATNPIGPGDLPFYPLTVGHVPVNDTSIPTGRGIEDTIFRRQEPANPLNKLRLFQATTPGQPGTAHPYFSNEILFKIGNNITTTSNVFAVWLTVGYFEVVSEIDVNGTPRDVNGDGVFGGDVLGEEIGLSQGGVVRHRFFSIVDRTAMVVSPHEALARGLSIVNPSATAQTVTIDRSNGIEDTNGNGSFNGGEVDYNADGVPDRGLKPYHGSLAGNYINWNIQAGMCLVIDLGQPNEETIYVESITGGANPQITAVFTREHARGFTVNIPGNPGPQPKWNPYAPSERSVVPYWEQLN